MRPQGQNVNEDEPKGLDWGIMIFGLGAAIFLIVLNISDGFSSMFFANPGGTRLRGIPGILFLVLAIVMFVFPLKKILKSKKKDGN